jgi:predicted glycosyltransferase
MVSAWASESGISLGQVKVDKKSNEITAIPRLLELLKIKGAIVGSESLVQVNEKLIFLTVKIFNHLLG